MKFNFLKQIKELEDENVKLQKYNLFLKDENIKLIQTYDLETPIRKASYKKKRAKVDFQKKQDLKYSNSKTASNKTSSKKVYEKNTKQKKQKILAVNITKLRKFRGNQYKLIKHIDESATIDDEEVVIQPSLEIIHPQKKIKLEISNDDIDGNNSYDNDDNNTNDIKNNNIIFIESDRNNKNDLIHVDNDYDLVNEFSFTSSFTKI